MDYEKKYKEAKGMAEEIIRYYKEHNRGDETSIEDLEQIFPELRDSEDEKIREMLIDSFTRADMGGEIYGKGVTYKQVIAWLEKQGESYTKNDVNDAYLKGISEAKNELEKQGEHKPAWSDEDENYLQSAENACEYQYGKNTSTILWLKSLKDRIGG